MVPKERNTEISKFSIYLKIKLHNWLKLNIYSYNVDSTYIIHCNIIQGVLRKGIEWKIIVPKGKKHALGNNGSRNL